MSHDKIQETLSTRAFFLNLGRNHVPSLCFDLGQIQDFARWREEFQARFMECLGPFPPPSALESRIVWSIKREGMQAEKILLKSAPDTLVPAIVLRPDSPNGAAIVAIHGHGNHGKDPVACAEYPEAVANTTYYNYSYGYDLAKAGFTVICPDLRPFGERSDAMPGERPIVGRDSCNVHALKGWLLGFNLLTYNLWDLRRCVDYLCEIERVDIKRIGSIGLSGGGAAAMHLTPIEPRISATAILCALNSYRTWAIEIDNFCGTQFLPGIYRFGDQKEICGLHAPKPLHFEIGGFDYGFPVSASMEALEGIKRLYSAAGASAALSWHIGFGGHQNYNTSVEFFKKVL